MTAISILTKVARTLLDDTGVRWPITTEMLDWLDTAQREVVRLKPTALVTATGTSPVKLVAGSRQTIGATALLLLDVKRNMGTDGLVPGRAILPMAKEVMDRILPDWHSQTASSEVKYFIYDPRQPKVFYVFPPQPASDQGYVDLVESLAPQKLATTSSPIELDDTYEAALIDYCLHRAYAKDNENANAFARSESYKNNFYVSLGVKPAGLSLVEQK